MQTNVLVELSDAAKERAAQMGLHSFTLHSSTAAHLPTTSDLIAFGEGENILVLLVKHRVYQFFPDEVKIVLLVDLRPEDLA